MKKLTKLFMVCLAMASMAVLAERSGQGTKTPDGRGAKAQNKKDKVGGQPVPDTSIQVERMLKAHGIQEGSDVKHGRIVAIGTWIFGGKSSSDEPYDFQAPDFPDDVNDSFETKRFKAMWKAYATGLSSIAMNKPNVGLNLTGSNSNQVMDLSEKLAGVVTVTMAESLDPAEEVYQVSVAVYQSKKREKMYSGSLKSKPGKYTLAEWIERVSGAGIICPRSYCDNEGVWWRVAGVPVELDEKRSPKKGPVAIATAKRYAYEAARRTIAVQVSEKAQIKCKITNTSDKSIDVEEKVSEVVKIEPLDTILPVDPSKTKWFELERVDPMSGAPVRCVIAALCSGPGAGVSRKRAAGR